MTSRLCGLFLTLLALSVVTPYDLNEVIKGNRRFAAKLYREVAKDKEKQNFIFCPINVQVLLAALSSADLSGIHQSSKKIRQVAELPDTNAETEDYIEELIANELNQINDDFKVSSILKLYFNNRITIREAYKNLLRNKYYAEVEPIDFSNYNALNLINTWVSQKTDNKIKNFFAPGTLPPNTQTIIIDILNLAGKWVYPFDETKNEKMPFSGVYEKVLTDMMVRNETSFYYYENDKAQYLKMKLDSYSCEIVLVLPKSTYTLEDIEENEDVFAARKFLLSKVWVKIPKFTISTTLKLKPVLQRMGLTEAFEMRYQFSGLSIPNNPYVEISRIFQKSTIEVLEWGVAASSSIATETRADEALGLNQISFIADRPFLFYVDLNEFVLFAGRVVQL